MRLWTLHPAYLDAKGLVALWNEGLLAQQVLQGKTVGNKHHPQLIRFREQVQPTEAIAAYLQQVYAEGFKRGYTFDQSKIASTQFSGKMSVNNQQLEYELDYLKIKLKRRDPARYAKLKHLDEPEPHPLFSVIRGPIANWEIL